MDSIGRLCILLWGCWLGLVIVSGIDGLITFIVGLISGEKLSSFKYLFFNVVKTDGKMKFFFDKFSPICSLQMYKPNETDEEAKRIYLIEYSISAVICIAYCVYIFFYFPREILNHAIFELLLGLGIWYIFDIIYHFLLAIKYFGKSKNMLFNYTKKYAYQLKAGVSLDDIEIPDYTALDGIAEVSDIEIATYQCLVFMQKIWRDDLAGIKSIIASMEKGLNIDYSIESHRYQISNIPIYYNLLFYYSYIQRDKEKAKYIYAVIGKFLRNDKDANGRRVLAYYTFYILEDRNTAKQYLSDAWSALPKAPSNAEKAYEEKLIRNLNMICC